MFPYGTSGERVDTLICFLCCGYFLTPLSLCATFPIFCVAKRRGVVQKSFDNMVLLFLFSVCATSLYTLRCNPRKAGHGKGGMCECLVMPWSVGGGKGTNLTDFLLCPNKPVSTFDFHYIYIDTVRHSQVGSMISVCLCTLFSLSLH